MPVSKIDLDKCVGCGTCVESCPMDVFRLDTVVEYRREASPCSAACPLGLRQREYHDLLQMGMLDEAARVMEECHPMPAVTGRLCPHPCEADCSRVQVDEAVNINGLERYLGDHLLDLGPAMVASGETEEEDMPRVAVVGSGPAGLSAAYFLRRAGFPVTVFDKEKQPGGLLRSVVPVFRLPEAIVDAQIDFYRRMGIDFRVGVRVGRAVSVADLRAEGYGAVVAATGAARPLGLVRPGHDATGVVRAMEFLAAARALSPMSGTEGARLRMSGPVVVIGGGSVAFDAARTAVRLGAAPVRVVCLERLEPGSKDSVLAPPDEIEQAMAEGIEIFPSCGVESFVVADDGGVSGVLCVECLSVRDEDGRMNPVYGERASPEVIEAHAVIVAIGQEADGELVPPPFSTDTRGSIVVSDGAAASARPSDSESAGTGAAGAQEGRAPTGISGSRVMASAAGPAVGSERGLFAAGDAVGGASTIVEALAAGKRAAEMAASYLRRGEEIDARRPDVAAMAGAPPADRVERLVRNERVLRPAGERRRDFREVATSLDGAQAQREAERCLTCGSRSRIAYLDDCQVCRLCQKYCPVDAIDVTEGQLLGSLHSWNVVSLGH